MRIARDVHDELGAGLTQLVLLAEVTRREAETGGPVRESLQQLCSRARALAAALDEVVWAINCRRDTLQDFVNHTCKYAGAFLAQAGMRCRLDIAPNLPALSFALPTRRNLFLAVKEALNNAV
jgi:signal transduction histidine kinase